MLKLLIARRFNGVCGNKEKTLWLMIEDKDNDKDNIYIELEYDIASEPFIGGLINKQDMILMRDYLNKKIEEKNV